MARQCALTVLFSVVKPHSIFSSPEPKAHWWAYRIRRPTPYVFHRPQSLNIFSSETTGPIEAKFHMESPWNRGTKVCSNGPGHMIKMAAMPIYIKNLKKSSPEPKGRWPWNLVCNIRYTSTTKFVQKMTLGWPWPILRQGQIWSVIYYLEVLTGHLVFINFLRSHKQSHNSVCIPR